MVVVLVEVGLMELMRGESVIILKSFFMVPCIPSRFQFNPIIIIIIMKKNEYLRHHYQDKMPQTESNATIYHVSYSPQATDKSMQLFGNREGRS